MRQQRQGILEYELKRIMLKKSLKSIFPFIINKAQKVNTKSPLFVVNTDLINSIKKFQENNEITYALGFFFCLILGQEYSSIKDNKDLLESTLNEMKNEKNWDDGNISFEVAIFFSFTFLNELYKDIAIDSHLLLKSNNPQEYLKNLRLEII